MVLLYRVAIRFITILGEGTIILQIKIAPRKKIIPPIGWRGDFPSPLRCHYRGLARGVATSFSFYRKQTKLYQNKDYCIPNQRSTHKITWTNRKSVLQIRYLVVIKKERENMSLENCSNINKDIERFRLYNMVLESKILSKRNHEKRV